MLKAASGEWAGCAPVSDCNGIMTCKWPVCRCLLMMFLESSSSQCTQKESGRILCARDLTHTISVNPDDKCTINDFYSYSRDVVGDALRSGLPQIK